MIQRNAAPGSGYIREPGEYVVEVVSATEGQSKGGKPMLTVTFRTSDGKEISSRFVKGVEFHVEALGHLKSSAGVAGQTAAALVGKKVGILVEPQEPTPDGKTYMQVAGYGKASDVSASAAPSGGYHEDNVPF